MELVGRAVKKSFPGFGVFSGIVESYDPSEGYFKVVYEDGDSEELEFGEIETMLIEMGEEAPPGLRPARRSSRGRRPKKRRRGEPDPAHHGQDDDLGGRKVLEMDVARQSGDGEKNDGLLEGGGVSLDTVSKENDALTVCYEVNENGGYLLKCTDDGNAENGGYLLERTVMNTFAVAEDACAKDMDSIEQASGNACLVATEGIELEGTKSGSTYSDGRCVENQGYEEKEEQSSKKRQRLSAKLSSPLELPLRRSARKASARKASAVVSFPSHCNLYQTVKGPAANNAVMSFEDNESVPVDSKPELPPSSKDLDLDGLPILDFFSIYTCLRSFCRVLFLSPFSLESFLAALRCKFANCLIDSIHFSILQTLKQHMEFLSEEGSQSAADCLSNLNWELMDLVTWPVYLAQYLLGHGSRMKSTLKFTHLKFLNTEYYEQPANVKLEILRCLCDNIIEVEAIRSEINTRRSESRHNLGAYNNVNFKPNDLIMTDAGGSLAQVRPEETCDGNSDECCLCRMDGSLICCDGCPAAFHSRCVGVAKDLLPEGDWYCPECLMEKFDGLVNLSKSSQGAEILGTDPHGRLYFSCCGYLLVSDFCDPVASSKFYNIDDLDGVIRVLQSSHASYYAISNTISTCWGKTLDTSESNCQFGIDNTRGHEVVDAQVHSKNLVPSDDGGYGDVFTMKSEDNFTSSEHSDTKSILSKELSGTYVVKPGESLGIMSSFASSKAPNELADNVNSDQLAQQTSASCYSGSGNPVNKPVSLAIQNKRCFGVAGWGSMALIAERRKGANSQLKPDPGSYFNNYSFGRIALSIAKNLIHRSSELNFDESKKSDEEIMAAQMKVISRRSMSFCWYSNLKLSLDVQKEKCGWCHACKTSTNGECIFVATDVKHLELSKLETVGHRSEKKKKSHIVSAMHHMLSIEDRLRGLLYGQWENPQHSNSWRKAVLKASDVSSVKQLLLVLESNLRRVALSSEWVKPVDYAKKVGSASNSLIGAMDVTSNYGSNRKQGKRIFSITESSSLQNATTSDTCWWRGGRLSRQIFNWKLLPCSLAFKGGRQAGCRRISTLVYPDGSEFARRSKCVAWRAAVEMAKTVAQLIVQIKDLDSNIKWSELSKNQSSLKLVKESKAVARLFRKVIIRRKAVQGADVRYLLDFGKRENIPPTVTRHGDVFVETSSERKKFWLSEIHVPLYLIKAYEEKKLARSEKKTAPKLLNEKLSNYNLKKLRRSKGLSFLFSKAEKLESELCGHCNKDVLVREAVTCQLCNGYFHGKHFRVQKGATTTTYTCNACKEKRSLKLKNQGHISVTQKKKKPNGKNVKSVKKKSKCVSVKSKKKPHFKNKGKKGKAKKVQSKKNKKSNDSRKRKRTMVKHSFWLNGLRWTTKPDDERGLNFRKNNILLPFQKIEATLHPVCCLCSRQYNSDCIFISCENCEGWFHGDVYGLLLKDIRNVIGFKCHTCRSKSMPTCPFSQNFTSGDLQSARECTIGEMFSSECQRIKEKHHNGTVDRCRAYSDSHSLLEDNDIICINADIKLDSDSILANSLPSVESFESADKKVQFPRHDDGIQTVVVFEEMDHDSNDMTAVSEFLDNDNCFDLKDNDIMCSKDEIVLNSETLSANSLPSTQSFESADEKVQSPRCEIEIQTVVASEKIEQDPDDMIRDSEFLVPGSSIPFAEPHSDTVLSASKLVDSEDGNNLSISGSRATP